MKMEEEYRAIVRTCLDFEFLDRYQQIIVPVLKKAEDGSMQRTEDIDVLAKLDRCLRFFFLCTVLNADLKVEECDLVVVPSEHPELGDAIRDKVKVIDFGNVLDPASRRMVSEIVDELRERKERGIVDRGSVKAMRAARA